jgi:hypothetical protein
LRDFQQRRRLSRMRRGVVAAADLLQREGIDGHRVWAAFITLTYRPGARWSPRHVSQFSDCARKWLARRGVAFRRVWVMELTRAGVPHYHVMVWLPHGVKLPRPDDAGWWPHGMTRIERARNPVGYLVKYASKGSQGDAFPRGARIHGCGGLSAGSRIERAWRMLPAYVRARFAPGDRARRCPGGGWVSQATGEWMPAARLYFVEGELFLELPP